MSTANLNTNARADAPPTDLSTEERIYHRDQLREARYAALADAEGFQQICFAVEAMGMRPSWFRCMANEACLDPNTISKIATKPCG